jgi:hypothetical protein
LPTDGKGLRIVSTTNVEPVKSNGNSNVLANKKKSILYQNQKPINNKLRNMPFKQNEMTEANLKELAL